MRLRIPANQEKLLLELSESSGLSPTQLLTFALHNTFTKPNDLEASEKNTHEQQNTN